MIFTAEQRLIVWPINLIRLLKPDAILAIVELFDDRWNHAMIFAHNPGITECQYQLTGYSINNIPTCGIAAIELDIDSWVEIAAGKGELLYFDYPKRTTEGS